MKNSSTVDNIPQQTRYFNLLNSLFAKITKPQSNTALNTHDSPTISTRKLFIEPLEIFRAITEKLLRGYCSYLTFTQVTIVYNFQISKEIFISIALQIPVLVNISLFNKFNLYIHKFLPSYSRGFTLIDKQMTIQRNIFVTICRSNKLDKMRARSKNIYYKQNRNLLTDNGQVRASSKQQQINVTHRNSRIRRQEKTQSKEKFGLCDFCQSYIVIAALGCQVVCLAKETIAIVVKYRVNQLATVRSKPRLHFSQLLYFWGGGRNTSVFAG